MEEIDPQGNQTHTVSKGLKAVLPLGVTLIQMWDEEKITYCTPVALIKVRMKSIFNAYPGVYAQMWHVARSDKACSGGRCGPREQNTPSSCQTATFFFFSQLEQHKQLDDPRRLIGERNSVRRAARRAKISRKTTAQRWPISCFRAVLKLVRDLCSDFALHAHELMWEGKKSCQDVRSILKIAHTFPSKVLMKELYIYLSGCFL